MLFPLVIFFLVLTSLLCTELLHNCYFLALNVLQNIKGLCIQIKTFHVQFYTLDLNFQRKQNTFWGRFNTRLGIYFHLTTVVIGGKTYKEVYILISIRKVEFILHVKENHTLSKNRFIIRKFPLK